MREDARLAMHTDAEELDWRWWPPILSSGALGHYNEGAANDIVQ